MSLLFPSSLGGSGFFLYSRGQIMFPVLRVFSCCAGFCCGTSIAPAAAALSSNGVLRRVVFCRLRFGFVVPLPTLMTLVIISAKFLLQRHSSLEFWFWSISFPDDIHDSLKFWSISFPNDAHDSCFCFVPRFADMLCHSVIVCVALLCVLCSCAPLVVLPCKSFSILGDVHNRAIKSV